MKLINKNELHQVSGAALTMYGLNIYVDTTGIPSRCVTEIENTMNAYLRVSENPNATESMLFNAVAPYAQTMIASGCDAYLDLYSARVDALVNA